MEEALSNHELLRSLCLQFDENSQADFATGTVILSVETMKVNLAFPIEIIVVLCCILLFFMCLLELTMDGLAAFDSKFLSPTTQEKKRSNIVAVIGNRIDIQASSKILLR